MQTTSVRVRCMGRMHTVVFHGHQIILADHPSVAAEIALGAFGARDMKCIKFLKLLRTRGRAYDQATDIGAESLENVLSQARMVRSLRWERDTGAPSFRQVLDAAMYQRTLRDARAVLDRCRAEGYAPPYQSIYLKKVQEHAAMPEYISQGVARGEQHYIDQLARWKDPYDVSRRAEIGTRTHQISHFTLPRHWRINVLRKEARFDGFFCGAVLARRDGRPHRVQLLRYAPSIPLRDVHFEEATIEGDHVVWDR